APGPLGGDGRKGTPPGPGRPGGSPAQNGRRPFPADRLPLGRRARPGPPRGRSPAGGGLPAAAQRPGLPGGLLTGGIPSFPAGGGAGRVPPYGPKGDVCVERRYRPYVAFFCMEYGLSHRFPVYSGGLGILAGDILKTARDLDLPLVGIGILWRQGYTRQRLDEHGWPHDDFPHYTPDFCTDTGVRVEVAIRGETVPLKVWKTEAFENAPLYLLDAGAPDEPHGWITGRLYNGHG